MIYAENVKSMVWEYDEGFQSECNETDTILKFPQARALSSLSL